MQADAEVQSAEWRGTPEEVAAARARRQWAEADCLIGRHRIGRRLAETLRIAAEDDATAYAVLLALLGILDPALQPVARRLADVEQRLANLELLATRRGARQ